MISSSLAFRSFGSGPCSAAVRLSASCLGRLDAGKPEFYQALRRQLAALLDGERDPVANAANTAALLYQLMPELNWAGFYFLRGEELVFGPFQGKPACVRIPSARVSAAQRWCGGSPSSSPTSTPSLAISPAIQPRAPNSSFR